MLRKAIFLASATHAFCLTSCCPVEAFQHLGIGKTSLKRSTRTSNSVPKASTCSKKESYPIGYSTLQSFISERAVAAAEPQQLLEFTSPEMQVFIEDTDAYGVMYNSNYLRAYDRALHMVSKSSIESKNQDGAFVDVDDKANILDHESWSLVEVNKQKFKRSPPLGGVFVIHGKLKSKSDNNQSEVWELEMASPTEPNNDNKYGQVEENKPIIYNTATVIIARSDLSSRCIPKPSPFVEGANSGTAEHTFTLYRDEFDMHLPTHIPLRNVLNLFERSRTMALGGPDTLRKMQEENDIVAVVTKNDQCSLVNLGHDETDLEQGTPKIECFAGQAVVVKTTIERKRRGMIMECKQTLLLPKSSEEDQEDTKPGRRRLAQAIITIMVLNGTTRKPTSDVPDYVLNGIFKKE